MVRLATFAALAALAMAAPAPQQLDFESIDELPEIVNPLLLDVPTVTASVVPVAKAIASAKADIRADPLPTFDDSPAAAQLAERDLQKRACGDALPVGDNDYLTTIKYDTYEHFTSDPVGAALANNAATPLGFVKEYQNQKKVISNSGFLLDTIAIKTYDPNTCATICKAKDACKGFNIAISRDPTKATGTCGVPPPTIFVRCTLYGSKVLTGLLKNGGQTRSGFQTGYIAGNGYNLVNRWAVEGFEGPEDLGDKAINAPLDCNGKNTYMGNKIYTVGVFTPQLCATACDETTAYNKKQAAKKGTVARTCVFFNTYILLENGDSVGQYCAMYTQYWDPSFATNKVQWRGDDYYTKEHSFTYRKPNDFGLPVCSTPV